MVAPEAPGRTKLYFGTVVTKVDKTAIRRALAALVFRSLLWFHKLYARTLLWSAAKRLDAR